MSFQYDVTRSGRREVVNSISRHISTVANVKPIVKTTNDYEKYKPKKPPTYPNPVAGDDFAEVREFQRRINGAKSTIDVSAPKSMERAPHLGGKHKRQTDYIQREHANRIDHLYRKIDQQQSKPRRASSTPKVNVDPKKSFDISREVQLSVKQVAQVNPRPSSASGRMESSLNRSTPRSSSASRTRPSTSYEHRNAYDMITQAADAFAPVGYGSKESFILSQANYTAFKRNIVETIIEERIFKKDDLEELFEQAKEAHAHLNKAEMDRIINEIRRELDE